MESLLSEWLNLKTRGEIKRAAKAIDSQPQLKEILLVELENRGLQYSVDWPAKKLLRSLLDRSTQAQERSNPIHRNEVFTCIHCQATVPKSVSKIRDHCPYCLRSIHVDITPGDRAANCGGILAPSGFFLTGGIVYIEYLCQRCSYEYRIRAHPEDQIPHSLSVKDIP